MAHRGMKKLRQVEKIGLIVLCVLMLSMLGLGTGSTCGGGGRGSTTDEIAGTFDIAGEKIDIDRYKLHEYGSYLPFQNHVLRSPPTWKYARNLFGQMDQRFENYDAEDQDLWTFIILHQAALKAGVHISPGAVEMWIRKFPGFQTREGKFDRERYLQFIRNAGIWATPIEFERMLARYLAVEYYLSLYQPLLRPTSQQVYDQWKTRHKRHDLQYVVQEAGPLRSDIDVSSFETEKVQKYYDRPDIRRKFLVPTKRSFEALTLLPGKMTDEEFAALKKLADEKELVYIGPEEARQYYYANESAYPMGPIRDKSREEWEAAHPVQEPGDGEDASTDDSGTEESGTEESGDQPLPKDDGDDEDGDDDDGGEKLPTVDADDGSDPEEEAEPADADAGELWEDPSKLDIWVRYERYFKVQVERELFIRKLLTRLLSDERVNETGLKAMAEAWGANYFVTEKPLDEYETLNVEAIGGHELRAAMNAHGPADEGAYCGKVLANGINEERVLFLYRVKSIIGEHHPDLGDTISIELLRGLVANMVEIPYGDIEKMNAGELMTKAFPEADLQAKQEFTLDDVLRQMLRQSLAEDAAAEKLDVLREMVLTGAQTFKGAAKEKGYELFTLNGVSAATPIPPEILPEEGKQLTPEQKQKNLVTDRKRFLIKGWMPRGGTNLTRIAKTSAGKFVEGTLADKATDAAYLVLVVAHSTPGPEEMPDVESREIWLEMVNRTMRGQMQSFFAWDQVVARYKLVVKGLTDKKTP